MAQRSQGNRRIAVITDTVPHCFHGGGGATAYGLVFCLLRLGHSVTVVAMQSDRYTGGKPESEHIAHLEQLGARVTILQEVPQEGKVEGLFRSVFARPEDVFPGSRLRPQMRKLLDQLAPEAVFCYHWDALSAVLGFGHAPIIGMVGDPYHLPFLFRRRFSPTASSPLQRALRLGKNAVANLGIIRRQVMGMNRLLRGCAFAGAFAAHHAAEFRATGVPCEYLRTPMAHAPAPPPAPAIPGEPSTSLVQGVHESPRNGVEPAMGERRPWKIVHIGHLQGIATISGIEILALDILPELDRLLSPGSYQVHLVGGFFEKLPMGLQEALRHPAVIRRGQVSPADAEFQSAHVILVPTPIELGIRVRIITAFSFGCRIVAHEANAKGIPELSHGENALLGKTGKDLARACHRIFSDGELARRLESGALSAFERFFSFPAFTATLEEILRKVERN